MRIVKRAVGVLLVVVLVAILAVTGLLVWVTARAFPQTSGTAAIPGLSANVDRGPRRDRDRRTSPPTRPTTCSWPRATSTPASGCGRWRSGATSRPGGWPRCSGRASSTPTSSSGRSAGASRRSGTSMRSRRRPGAVLDAYTEGVNAWLDGHRGSLGLAFLAAGVTPEPWTDLDTVAWGKVQAWNLGGNFDSEVFRYLADAQLGDPARTDELFPAYREDAPVITPTGLPGSGGAGAHGPAGRQASGQPRSRPRRLPVRSPRPKPPPGARSPVSARASSRPPGSTPPTASPRTTGSARTTGSSAPGCRRPAARSSPTIRTWASRCRRSGSSTACIAGPSRTPARMTSRASRSPACPGVVLGHNARIAWGATNIDPDVQDLVIEKVDPADPNAYLRDGASTPFDVRHEQIKVAGDGAVRPRDPIDGPRPDPQRRRRATEGRPTDGDPLDGEPRAGPDVRGDPRPQQGGELPGLPRVALALWRPGAELRLRRRRRPHRLPVPGLRPDPLEPRRPRRSPGPRR